MDYDTVVQVFFQPTPPDTPTPYPVAHARPARRLRDACEPLAMHAVWSRITNERLAAHGLNFLTSYVWGRAASLGEPPASLVVAAFAAFEPGFLTSVYEEARSHLSRTDLLAIRDESTITSLQQVLGEEDVTFAVATLRRGLAAADGTGRALFSGLLSLPWPEAPQGQLWRACDMIREHRGDSHIAAYIAAGFDPVAMNILTELYVGMPLSSYTATRGWSPDVITSTVARLQAQGLISDGALTPEGLRIRDEIEERTDAMEWPIIDAIGSDLDSLIEQLNRWSAACIAAAAFPPNDLKRAAG
ncbi:MAG TPA: hypothetical protein VKY19_04065 [Ktedonosporobacter sp.]|jgi:hypothetical protein|nr:hypothetical protein [Ktedonosporobacter sp.]